MIIQMIYLLQLIYKLQKKLNNKAKSRKKEKDKPVGPGKFMIFERNEEGEYVNTGEEAGKELVDDQCIDHAAKDEESFKLAYKTQYTDPARK